MPTVTHTAPAAPARPRPYRPAPTVPLAALTVGADGTARCVSGNSGQAYEMHWTPRGGRWDILSCGCAGCYRYAACSHMVQAQRALDAAHAHSPSGGLLIGLSIDGADCRYCAGGARLRARVYAHGRG